jgi:hypothetical protein
MHRLPVIIATRSTEMILVVSSFAALCPAAGRLLSTANVAGQRSALTQWLPSEIVFVGTPLMGYRGVRSCQIYGFIDGAYGGPRAVSSTAR